MKPCENCGTDTSNPRYCGRSCAAKVNNKIPKRKRASSRYSCASCGEPIPHNRKYCQSGKCLPYYVNWSEVTLKEVREKRKYQVNSRIRDLSRRKYLHSDSPKKCVICDYAIHFEVCHIKGISSFPETATLSEINNLGNLVALCRNHHWELDHGLLETDALSY